MAIYDRLQTFHQVEPNNLKGLQPGFVVSQMEVKSESTLLVAGVDGKSKFLENGHLCSIGADGIDIWADGKVMFLSYADPIYTIIPGDKYFAVNVAEENPRLVQLIPGDEWMSDIDYETDSKYSALWATINKYVIKIKDGSKLGADKWYKVDTLADGTKAYHYMFVGGFHVGA